MQSTLAGTELAHFGPGAAFSRPSQHEANAYCRQLARTHYENFTVASWLLPAPMRQHFANVYAYCRWADDLADETGDGPQSLQLLDWWEEQLDDCYAGRANHPVFVALQKTIHEFAIPREPLADLLVALRRDQKQVRYATRDELLSYCAYSANPVGRLVLYLGGCHDETTVGLSNSICTGLQLANFWQDVARDRTAGRVYIPQADLERFHCRETDLDDRPAGKALRSLLAELVDWSDGLLQEGFPLVPLVPRWLQVDVELFLRGGRAILAAIRKCNYDVLSKRPTVGKWTRLRLFASAWCRRSRRGAPQ